MKSGLLRLWRWFLDRMSERSTKTNLFSLLGILAAIGLLGSSLFDALKFLVEQGQGAYANVYELVLATISNVKSIIGIVAAFLAAVSNVIGAFSPDSKGGKTYDLIMKENDLDPSIAYAYSLDPDLSDHTKGLEDIKRTFRNT